MGCRWSPGAGRTLCLLTPAVTTDGTSGLSSFRGISGLYNGNSVDGANNTQAFFSEARGRAIIVAYVYSPDSIKEFEVSCEQLQCGIWSGCRRRGQRRHQVREEINFTEIFSTICATRR